MKLYKEIINNPEDGLSTLNTDSNFFIEKIYKDRYLLSILAASKLIPQKIKELEEFYTIDLSGNALNLRRLPGDRFLAPHISLLFSESCSAGLPRELKIDFINYTDFVFLQARNYKDEYLSLELQEKTSIRISANHRNLEKTLLKLLLNDELNSIINYNKLSLELIENNKDNTETKPTKV